MALVLADRVRETTTTTGTGTVTLLGAFTGYQSFAAVGNGNTTYYTIAGQTSSEWEVGIGTYTSAGTTLSRTTVLSSSNAGSLVNFSAGTKDVFVTYPSSRSIYADGTTLTATNSSVLPIASGGTGATTRQDAMDALAGAVTSGSYLRGNGADVVMNTIQAADVPTLNQNTTGSAATLTTGRTIAITGDLAYTSPSFNGSTNVTAAGTLATVNTNVGSFTNASITVNGKGLITAASSGTAAVTSVTGTSPVVSSGGTTPAISMPAATTSVSGYLTSTDWNTFNGKQAAGSYVTVGGALGTPSSGTLTNCTFPTLNQNTTGTASNVTGTVAVANGGTGQTTYTNGQLLIGNTTGNTLTKATLTQGTGVTITNGTGSITISATGTGGTVTSVGGTGTVNGIALSGTVTTSGNLTLGGTLSGVSLTSQVSGTLPVANGGTGVTTSTGSGNNVLSTSPTLVTPILGTPTSGNLTNCTFPTLNQNTTGSSGSCTGNAATATTATNQSGGTVSATTGSFSGQLSVAQSTTLIGNGINLNAAGSGFLRGTNNDGASSTVANVQLMSWDGIGFSPSITGQPVPQGENAVWISARTGTINARSTITAPTFVGALTGNVTGNVSGSSGSCTGNAANVTGTVAVANGGTGVTTSTGTGSTVRSTSPTLTTPNINSAQFATVSGTAPIYPCRAWVNFNGTGTIAIRGSGNVSSLTDNGTGNYTVNFTTAMPDTNYTNSGNIGGGGASGGYNNRSCQFVEPGRLTTSVQAITGVATTSGLEDQSTVYISVFR